MHAPALVSVRGYHIHGSVRKILTRPSPKKPLTDINEALRNQFYQDDIKSGPVMNVLMRLMILVVWLVRLQRQREEFLSYFSTFNLQSCRAFCLQEI